MKYLFLFIIGITLAACQPQVINHADKQRKPMPQAKNAEAWLKQVNQDLDSQYQTYLREQFAELPPEEHWEQITTSLNQLSEELADEGERRFEDSRNSTSGLKYQFLSKVLSDNDKATYASLKSLILATNEHGSSWGSDDLSRALYHYSPDPKETASWLEANPLPQSDNRGSSHYNRSKKDPVPAYQKDLAEGRVDEGVAKLWKVAETTKDHSTKLKHLGQLMRIGELTENTELEEKAYQQVQDYIFSCRERGVKLSAYEINDWLGAAAKRDQWPKIDEIVSTFDLKKMTDSWDQSIRAAILETTLRLSGNEVFVKQLEGFITEPGIGKAASISLLGESTPSDKEIGPLYVRALSELGRTDDAWTQLRYLIALNRSNDDYYLVGKELFPDSFSDYLDRLHRFDSFEERPLIWKAQLLLDQGKNEQALEVINQAIALDPSDGDQGKVHRMRAYEVLGKIHAALGDQEKAKFFAEVVKAIREGEQADDFLYAGLKSEAIRRYQDSLGHFNDAYCLQSRLALTLARQGRFDEAVPHFEKAFELMPVSFGPKESHCFGCEGLFSDKRVFPIAKQILSRFEEKHPNNPRAPYLLGLVLEEMDDKQGALEAYRRAIKIDPKYINALKNLEDLLENSRGNSAELEAVIQKIMAVAPYPDLPEYYAKRVDLRQLWLDAKAHAESPLDLPAYPLEFGELITKDDMHFVIDNQTEFDSLDGWTPDELRRNNQLLLIIDYR